MAASLVAAAIGRGDLLTDPRFSDPAKLTANMPQLTAILDEIFAAQPMSHWQQVFQGVNVTFGDGSVHFVNSDMSIVLYQRLSVPNDGKVANLP